MNKGSLQEEKVMSNLITTLHAESGTQGKKTALNSSCT